MARKRETTARKWRDGHTSSSIAAASSERLLGRVVFSLLSLVLIAFLIWMLLPRHRPQTYFDALRITDTALLKVPPLAYAEEDLAWLSAVPNVVHGDVQRLKDLQKWPAREALKATPQDALVVYVIAHGATNDEHEPCLVPSDFGESGSRELFPVRDLLQKLSAVETRCTLVVLDCSRTPPDEYWGWKDLGFTAGLKELMPSIDNPNLWVLATADGQMGLNVHGAEHSLFGLAWENGLRTLKAGQKDVSLLELCQQVQRTCLVNSLGRQKPVLLQGGAHQEVDLTAVRLPSTPALQFAALPELPAEAPEAEAAPSNKHAVRRRSQRPSLSTAVWNRSPATLAWGQAPKVTKEPAAEAAAEPAAPDAAPDAPSTAAGAPPPTTKARGTAAEKSAATAPPATKAAPAPATEPAVPVIADAADDDAEQLLVQAWSLRDALETPEPDPRTSPLMYAPQLWREVNALLQALEDRALGGKHYRDAAVRDLQPAIEFLRKLQSVRTLRGDGGDVLPAGENRALFKNLADAWRVHRESLQNDHPPAELLQVAWHYAQAINRARDLMALEPRLAAVSPPFERFEWNAGREALKAFEDAVSKPVRWDAAFKAARVRIDGGLKSWLDRSLTSCTERSGRILATDVQKRTLADGFVLETLLSSPLWRSDTRRRWRQAIRQMPAELVAFRGESFPPPSAYQWPSSSPGILPEPGKEQPPLAQLTDLTSQLSGVQRYRLASLLDPRDAERYPDCVPLGVTILPESRPATIRLALKSTPPEINLDEQPDATLEFEVEWSGDPNTQAPPESVRIAAALNGDWLRLADRAGSLPSQQQEWNVPLNVGRATFALTLAPAIGKQRRTLDDPAELPLTVTAEAGGVRAEPGRWPVKLPVWRHVQLSVETPFQGTVRSEPLPFKERHSALRLELHANRQSPTVWSLANPSPVPQVVDVKLVAVHRLPSDPRSWNWPLGRLTLGGRPFPELNDWLLRSNQELTREADLRVIASAVGVELPAGASAVPVPWGRQGKTEDGKVQPAESKPASAASGIDVVNGLACLIREGARPWTVHWIELLPLDPKRFLDASSRLVQMADDKVQVTFDLSLKALDPLPPHPLPPDFASDQHPFQIDWLYQRTLAGRVEQLVRSAKLLSARQRLQLTARFQPERNLPMAPAWLTVDGWPRAVRFEVPLAPSVNLKPGDEILLGPKDGNPRVEIREVSSLPNAADKRPARIYRHPSEPQDLPSTEGVSYQLAPFPQNRRLRFAAQDKLHLAVRFEADGPFDQTPCNEVVLKKGGIPTNRFFADRRRAVQLLKGDRFASGELDIQLDIADFQEVIDCSGDNNLESELEVEFINRSREPGDDPRRVIDAWQIVIDGAPPSITDFKSKELAGQLLEVSLVARDELSAVAAVQIALSPKNKSALMPEDYQPATRENGRYVVRFPTAEVEAKVRAQPHHLYALAEDEVGNRSEKELRDVPLPKPAAPAPLPTKEPDNTPAPGFIFGQLLYPSGVPAKGVKLAPESPNPEVATAGDGTFTFDKLQAGKEYRLRVLHTVSGKSYELSASAKAVTAKELPKEPVKLFLQESKKGPPKP